jgi:prephenate dehydratase
VQAANSLLETDADGRPVSAADAAIAPAQFLTANGGRDDLVALAEGIIDNPNAVTRFALVSKDRRIPPSTGADKTSIIAELPDDQAGSLLGLLEQFSTRGINLSLIESRPIGDSLGRYRFVIDADGHILEERMADALLGLRRFSPKLLFLGSYPRADHVAVDYHTRYSDDVFVEARDWLRGLLTEEPAESS